MKKKLTQMVDILKPITQDRPEICNIISEMLDNPDMCGIYPTTIAFDKLEKLINNTRIIAINWAWGRACSLLDNEIDPREYVLKHDVIQEGCDYLK